MKVVGFTGIRKVPFKQFVTVKSYNYHTKSPKILVINLYLIPIHSFCNYIRNNSNLNSPLFMAKQ